MLVEDAGINGALGRFRSLLGAVVLVARLPGVFVGQLQVGNTRGGHLPGQIVKS